MTQLWAREERTKLLAEIIQAIEKELKWTSLSEYSPMRKSGRLELNTELSKLTLAGRLISSNWQTDIRFHNWRLEISPKGANIRKWYDLLNYLWRFITLRTFIHRANSLLRLSRTNCHRPWVSQNYMGWSEMSRLLLCQLSDVRG